VSKFEELYWNLIDAITWIMYRDVDSITGSYLITSIKESYQQKASSVDFSDAKDSLLLELNKGRVKAQGTNSINLVTRDIPANKWLELQLDFSSGDKPPSAGIPYAKEKWLDVKLSSKRILAIWQEVIPENDDVYYESFELNAQIKDINLKIIELESFAANGASEVILQNEKVAEYRNQISALKDRRDGKLTSNPVQENETQDIEVAIEPASISKVDSSTATPISTEKKLILITPPKKTNDFYREAFLPAVKVFENENSYTPSESELWNHLINSPREGYKTEFERKKNTLCIDGIKCVDRRAFRERYNRYYPKTKGEN
jgi:hypothetical protein